MDGALDTRGGCGAVGVDSLSDGAVGDNQAEDGAGTEVRTRVDGDHVAGQADGGGHLHTGGSDFQAEAGAVGLAQGKLGQGCGAIAGVGHGQVVAHCHSRSIVGRHNCGLTGAVHQEEQRGLDAAAADSGGAGVVAAEHGACSGHQVERDLGEALSGEVLRVVLNHGVEAGEVVDVVAGSAVGLTQLFKELDVDLVVLVVAGLLDQLEAFVVATAEDWAVLAGGDFGVLEEVGGDGSLHRGTGDHRVHPAVIAQEAELLVVVVDLEAGVGDALQLDVAGAGVEGGQGDQARGGTRGKVAAGRVQIHGADDGPVSLVERQPDGVVGHGGDSLGDRGVQDGSADAGREGLEGDLGPGHVRDLVPWEGAGQAAADVQQRDRHSGAFFGAEVREADVPGLKRQDRAYRTRAGDLGDVLDDALDAGDGPVGRDHRGAGDVDRGNAAGVGERVVPRPGGVCLEGGSVALVETEDVELKGAPERGDRWAVGGDRHC